MAKCRKCREGKKHNMESSPQRPPRGSIRKAKREEMRKIKMEQMAQVNRP